MKNKKYLIPVIILVVGIILIAVGGVLIARNIGMGDFETDDFSESFEVTEGVTVISSECGIAELSIKAVDRDDIYIDCKSIREEDFEVSYENGRLEIEYDVDEWENHINLGGITSKIEKGTITVEVPSTDLKMLEIEGGVGVILIENLKAEKAKIKAGVGEFSIRNCNFTDNTNIQTGVGELSVDSSKFNGFTLDSGVGNCKFTDCFIGGNAKIDAGIGNVTLELTNRKSDFSFDVENGIGQIFVDGETAFTDKVEGAQIMEIKNGIGEIEVDFKV